MNKTMKIFDYQQSIPVILGGFINGLGLVRSFGEKQIPTITLDYQKNIAHFSKYTKGLICPHPVKEEKAFIAFLEKLGQKMLSPGFILATSDEYLLVICKHRKLLEKYFHFPMSDQKTIELCHNKAKLYHFARKHNIPCPFFLELDNALKINDIRNQLVFPCILKPLHGQLFKQKIGSIGKNIIFANEHELNLFLGKMEQCQLSREPFVIQEYIPGSPKDLYTFTSYSNPIGNLVGYSIGHKIRQFPPNSGTICSGKVTPNKTVYELGQKLIEALGFYGIANTEFKRNSKTGEFQLIEINPRPGKWNTSALATGVNLPFLAYQDFMGSTTSTIISSEKEIIWLDTLRDSYNALYRYKKEGFPKRSMSFAKWHQSISGKKVDAVWQTNDIKPFFRHLYDFIMKKFS